MTVFRRPSLRGSGLSAWIWLPPVVALFGWMAAFPPAFDPYPARAAAPATAPAAAFGTEDLADDKWLDAEEILAPFQAGASHTRVIVNLVPSVDVARFASWDDASALADYRAEVAALVDSVLAALPSSSLDLLERYDNQASFAALVTEDALGRLTDEGRVLAIEPDRLVTSQTRQGIALMAADEVNDTYDGTGVAIAITDTGIDYGHEALGGGGFPNDKVIGGRDTGDDDDDPFDVQGHGTSVAGIAAGDDTSVGDWAGGVAPGAKLYALKISHGSGGSAYTSNMIEAWDWCITHKNDDPANPILVVNCSFGGGQYAAECNGSSSATAIDNLAAAGITFVASSGNDGWCDSIASPACAPNAISVGAVYDGSVGGWIWCVDSESCAKDSCGCCYGWKCADSPTTADLVNCYSNSADFLDVLAPSWIARSPATGGGYTDFSGTSAASPYAAGAVAVLQHASLASFGTLLAPNDMRDLLTSTGTPVVDPKSGIETPRVHVENAVLAMVPLNDDCAGALTASLGETPFSNVAATTDGPEQPEGCGKAGDPQIGADVWFAYTADCDGTATISICDADFDTELAVYEDACPAAGPALACNDDGECGDGSTVSLAVEADTTYLLRIGGYGAAEGTGTLVIECVPAHDDCASALAVGDGVHAFDNRGATASGPDETGCGAGEIDADVWYRYTAPCAGTVEVSLCYTDLDSRIAVYPDGPCPESAAAVACAVDGCGAGRARVEFPAADGEVFLIRAGGAPGEEGFGTIVFACVAAGDACEDAIALEEGTAPFTTAGASTDGPSGVNCGKDEDGTVANDSWFRYEAPSTGTVTLETCGADFDTELAVYRGEACPSGGAPFVCDDDGCGSSSRVSFFAVAGEVFRIRVGGSGGATGSGDLVLTHEPSVVADCQGVDGVEVLKVNYDDGIESGHLVSVDDGSFLRLSIAKPPAGGNGKFVVHLNEGAPTEDTVTPLPASLGSSCFDFLLPGGAAPVAIWNCLGKEPQVGGSAWFGEDIEDPGRAPTVFLEQSPIDAARFPVGSSWTAQGVILNPAATSPKTVSVTNAVVFFVE